MKKLLSLILALAFAATLAAQNTGTGPVTKYTSGAAKGQLTENLTAGDGVTIGATGTGVINATKLAGYTAATLPVSTATQTALDAKQTAASQLTSWASVTRAGGFDTFAATPSGANLAALLTTALPASRGGFGADISAQSGVPLFATGVATFTSTSGTGNFVRATSPTIVTPTITTSGTSRVLIEKSFPTSSDAEAAPALLIRDSGGDPDASGALLNITSQTTAPANRSLFRVLRTGGVYIWDYIKVSPVSNQDLYAGSAMVAIASDLDASGTTLRVRNRMGHDLFAANDDAGFHPAEGPDVGGNVPRVFTIAGSANSLRPGMIVWGMANDSGNAALVGVRATPPRVEVRNGNDTALIGIAASSLSIGQTTPPTGVALAISSGTGPIYNNAQNKNAFVFASSGATYGTIQSDSGDVYSLGTTSSITTLGTPMLQWTTTAILFNGPAQLKSYTVSQLPSASSYPRAIAYVSDANATTRLTTVAGGGSNKVTVYSDGSNWLIQ